jgi:uncharacterized hydrophobic protein (TIGR00271 family)
MRKIIHVVRQFISERFNLNEDRADEQLIIDTIKKDVSFKGVNVWALIFAIFIASIGLNVNSPAVIIGAMLISPLMGPIMGVGLGIGINDFELLKGAAKNFFIATVVSIVASFLYFSITPLSEASSELLARTNPSVWDVFIAFFGGLAGIVAGTRKEKSNVIPGVAIATALMPPLCTAGFGLATGKWFYFFGALYLFFINSLFICLATFIIVKHLKFHKKEFASPERERRVSRYILIIVILTIVPSIYLAYRIAQKSFFENNAKKFTQAEFRFPRTQVITRNFVFDGNKKIIELLLIGQPVTDGALDSIRRRLPKYKLDGTQLIVYQGLDAKQKVDLTEIKASILEDVFEAEHKKDSISRFRSGDFRELPDIKNELKVLYPDLLDYSISQVVIKRFDGAQDDSVILFTGTTKKELLLQDKNRIKTWLCERLRVDSIKVFLEYD